MAQNNTSSLLNCSILVTGGTAGLGRQTILELIRQKPKSLYFTGRNLIAAKDLIEEIKSIEPDVQVRFVECDFSSLGATKSAIDRLQLKSLDVLLCNAGIMATAPALTRDGYEEQFGINHLAHAMVIQSALPALQKSGRARIVLLTSTGYLFHPAAGIRFDTLRTTQAAWHGFASWIRYGQSKLANILYARALSKRYPKILCVAIHPGVIITGLTQNLGFFKRWFVYVTAGWQSVSLEEGVANSVWSTTSMTEDDSPEPISGRFYMPVGKLADTDATARDEALENRLWDWTQEQLAHF